MRRFILLGVLLYLFLVARQFPADVAAAWLLPETVTAYGVDGSIWDGSAEAVDPGNGELLLGPTRWTIRPLWLLTAHARGTLSTQLGEGSRLNTHFSKALIGDGLALSKTQGIVDLAMLPTSVLPNQVDGRVGLSFEHLKLESMWPTDATGSIDLVDLSVSQPRQVALGSFEILFDGRDGDALVGKVSDTDSKIAVTGTLSVSPDRAYLFEGTALAGAGADRSVADGMRMLGPGNPDGSVSLSFSGTIE